MKTHFDSQLISQAVSGDLQAREELLAYCRPLLKMAAIGYCGRNGTERFDASDIAQMTALEAHKSLKSFRGQTPNELLCWLNTILKRSFFRMTDFPGESKIRMEQNQPLNADESLSFVWQSIPAKNESPAEQVIRGEFALNLAREIEKLPQRHQTVIHLRFLDGLKLREIADRLDTTTGSVAGLLRQAVQNLQKSLPAEFAEGLKP